MIKRHDISVLTALAESKRAEEILTWIHKNIPGGVTVASSMGPEDQVIFDMINRLDLNIPVFTLDTGRLFNETYELIAMTEKKYRKKIRVFLPDAVSVEKMVDMYGVNLFRESVGLRKKCCQVRKLEPLSRALAPYSAWICGLRREQSVTRTGLSAIETDERGRLKISPLVNWSEKDVWDYIGKYDVPYNGLHKEGFTSIGCACCTRAVEPAEHIRAGRWWWEAPEHKECGLHWNGDKAVRECHIKENLKCGNTV